MTSRLTSWLNPVSFFCQPAPNTILWLWLHTLTSAEGVPKPTQPAGQAESSCHPPIMSKQCQNGAGITKSMKWMWNYTMSKSLYVWESSERFYHSCRIHIHILQQSTEYKLFCRGVNLVRAAKTLLGFSLVVNLKVLYVPFCPTQTWIYTFWWLTGRCNAGRGGD